MKHPFRILPVFRMKTAVSGDVRVEHFYGSHAVELQLPIPRTPSSLGKAQRLPAHQHDRLPGGATNTIRMNHAPRARLPTLPDKRMVAAQPAITTERFLPSQHEYTSNETFQGRKML